MNPLFPSLSASGAFRWLQPRLVSLVMVCGAVWAAGSATLAADPPQTGFEERGGDGHTTHEEELAFLEAVAAASPRVALTVIGESLENRPIHLARVGHPAPPADAEIAAGRSILIIGGQHGNEPAGREMALTLLRDLAFTDDPELTAQLAGTTVLFIPTANPDGRVADTRGNAGRVDPNRDHLALSTPEARAMGMVFRDFTPDIIVDAHEGPSTPNNPDQIPRLELSWPRNLNVHPEIRQLSEELVEDHVFPAIRKVGYTARVYGSPGGAGGGDERILRNVTGLRHSIGMLIETFGSTPQARAELQVLTVLEVLRFHRERTEEIAAVLATVRGGDGIGGPVYWGGADWDPPSGDQILDTPPCGYLLNPLQADLVSVQADLFPLESETVGEGSVYFPMEQSLHSVIPLLLDPRAAHNRVEGLALDDCEDPGAQEPPGGPPPSSPPAQFFTDFSADAPGGPPAGWSEVWRPSQWTVVAEPRVLRHTVEGGSSRRALAWDLPEVVSGDVEVRTSVRFLSSNTYFQLPILMSGEAGSENAYYIDARRDTGTVRLNRYLNGAFTTLTSAPLEAEESTWYHLRFRREGAALRLRIWEDGEAEPSQWQINHQDTSHMTGAVGFAGFQGNSINDWAFLGVGTGGEMAPDECQLRVVTQAEPTVFAGERWTASVEAEGNGPFFYQWFWEGEELPEATGSTFTLDAAAPENAGLYTVEVTSFCGAQETVGFSLEVAALDYPTWPARETLPENRREPDDRNGPLQLQNLLAYALGLNPLTAGVGELPRLVSTSGDPAVARFRFQRALGLTDASVRLEVSRNLSDWEPAEIVATRLLESGYGWERVEVEVALPETVDFFLRLRAAFDS